MVEGVRSLDYDLHLVVEHRLDTVIDHDYILDLGHGRVSEFGRPCDLRSPKNRDGAFSKMVDDTGPTTSSELRRRATPNLATAFLEEKEESEANESIQTRKTR